MAILIKKYVEHAERLHEIDSVASLKYLFYILRAARRCSVDQETHLLELISPLRIPRYGHSFSVMSTLAWMDTKEGGYWAGVHRDEVAYRAWVDMEVVAHANV